MNEPPPQSPWGHPRVKAFLDAGRGVGRGLRTEPHLRFHFFAASMVLLVLHIFDSAKVELAPWAPVVIVLLFAVIMAMELVNSAVEATCNAITLEHNTYIGAAKDMAAGAVLVLAVAAALVGVGLLGPGLIQIFYCGDPSVMTLSTLPAVVALPLLYLLHHFFPGGWPGRILALLTLWDGFILCLQSPPWIAIPWLPILALGLYGSRMREVRT